MISRRNFLHGLLAAAAAPAIVRSESLMKIWVPPEPKLILAAGDWTVDAWLKPTEGQWAHIAVTVTSGLLIQHYVDGQKVRPDHPLALLANKTLPPLASPKPNLDHLREFRGEINELRITNALRKIA